MKRTGFKRKPSPVLKPVALPANVIRADGASKQVNPQEKDNAVRSKTLRDSARGMKCTLRIKGVCNGDPETTVLCHLPGPIKRTKSTDLACVAYGCSACHDVLDGRVWDGDFLDKEEWYMRRAQTLTLAQMQRAGLIEVKGAA